MVEEKMLGTPAAIRSSMTNSSRSTAPFPLRPTRHYLERASHRHLRDNVRDFILRHGVDIRAAGATHLVVMERRLPEDLRGTEAARLARDWILVVGEGGALITCYRRRRAVRFIHRKSGRPSARSEGRPRQAPKARARHSGGGAAC
ncbi:hypothetical protein [Sorangium cellulosum]|uniref:hypothetical protein n=1 Tax=Sorangium cellulosum TaxID=56 RepID=UPI0018F89A26|nr:hypothetical protein [Sorangium cellulosum]